MRNRFDQLGKQIGQEALGPSGSTIVHDEISPEAQQADLRHEPDPARDAERARLGLLGRMAASPCLIELYSEAPGPDEARACLHKHLAFWHRRARQARARKDAAPWMEPFLWIVAAGRPSSVMSGLGLAPWAGWPPGVYVGPEILRVGIVAASELSRERETLLVRLMAGGRLLLPAIEDLASLAPDAPERALATPALLRLRYTIADEPDPTPEEREFIVSTENIVEKIRNEGRSEGRATGLHEALFAVYAARFGAVPPEVASMVRKERDLDTLRRWVEAVATRSAEEFAAALRGSPPA